MSLGIDRGLLLLAIVTASIPAAASSAHRRHKQVAVDPKRAEAEAAAKQATVAFNLGRFDEALTGYSHAYELVQISGLLFNIAQCHRRLAEHDKAIFFYKGYLRENPKAKNAAQVEAMIDEEEKAPQAAAKKEESVAPLAISATQPSTQSAAFALPPPPDLRPAPETVAPVPIYKRWWFWVSVVGGAAVVATAVAVPVAISEAGPPQGSLGTLDRRQ